MKTRVTLIAVILMACAVARSADWPQLRGPNRDGKSADTGLLKQWPEAGPALLWRNDELGGGYSAPSIAAGRIYGMSNRDGDEIVWALSEEDGREIWATRIGPAYMRGSRQGIEGPGCTPTVDGELLYVLGAGGELACLQTKDGKIVWHTSLVTDFGGRVPTWRYQESPLVDGDKVICTPGAQDAMMVALDKLTGETIWKTRMSGGGNRPGASYASAIAIDAAGQRQYVQLAAHALIGVSASDGKLLWQYGRAASKAAINCAMPVFQDGNVFASSAYDTGGGLVKLSEGPGGTVQAEEVYFTDKLQNHHGGMIIYDGCLYGASGGNSGGALVCLDFKTGNVLWDRRAEDGRRGKGALALADGRLYFRMENGAVVLIEPSGTKYIERGRFQQPDRTKSPAWTYPVIANGRLYIRDQGLLLCYDVKAGAPTNR